LFCSREFVQNGVSLENKSKINVLGQNVQSRANNLLKMFSNKDGTLSRLNSLQIRKNIK